jgi:hypothetical protein
MKPTRVSTLVVIAGVCAVAAWLLLDMVYSDLPPLPWTGVPSLLVAAAVEAWLARDVRARILGRKETKPLPPLYVARVVVVAKASSQAAAVFTGLAAGFVIYLAGSLNDSIPRRDALTAGITLAAAVVLGCAALYLEYCCRVPKDPGEGRSAGVSGTTTRSGS